MSQNELDFKKTQSKVLEKGPLESVFPCSTSKILDFLATFKDWDYSISDIAKHSGLSFKTALHEIKNLEYEGVINQTRTVGKATMYKLNLDSKQGQYIEKLILERAKKRVREQIEALKSNTVTETHRSSIEKHLKRIKRRQELAKNILRASKSIKTDNLDVQKQAHYSLLQKKMR